MGSNKKHRNEKNRDNKKKRHRSRSHSSTPEKDHHRHHRKHKRRERRTSDSDIEIVTTPPPPPTISKNHETTPPPPAISRQKSSSPSSKGGGTQASLSIDETNKLRIKLGMKPLEVDTGVSKEEPNKIKDDLGEFYHKPAKSTTDALKTEKIRDKLSVLKQKRQIETNLSKVKLLGDDDSGDDTNIWVIKNRKRQEEKKKAEERAKLLDQLDKEFGIDDLVKEEVHNDRRTAYSHRDLKGMQVEHNIENFIEGQTVILTLADKDVLDDGKDVLVNVNMKDNEAYERSVLNKVKKPKYDAYNEENFDEYGLPNGKILEKYDEEINGQQKQNFTLGVDNAKHIQQRRKQGKPVEG